MAHGWNALQQAQIPSNQSPDTPIGSIMESEETFAEDIEQLIEKETLPSMTVLEDFAASDMNDLNTESSSLSWQEVSNSADLEQDKSGDKEVCNSNNTSCHLADSGEGESVLEEVLEPAFLNNLVDYSDISSCSETESNLNCSLSTSIEVNYGGNHSGQSLEREGQNSNDTLQVLSHADVCHSTLETNISEINQQQDAGESGPPKTMDESRGGNVQLVNEDSDCRKDSHKSKLPTNLVDQCPGVQGMDDLNNGVPLSAEGPSEKRTIPAQDSLCSVDQTMVDCKEHGTSQVGSTCALKNPNIETSSTINGDDENNCTTIETLSDCQLERKTPDPRHGMPPLLEKQKCFTSNNEQVVERSSFGFLESCFGLKSKDHSSEEVTSLERAEVNHTEETDFSFFGNMTQNGKCGLFNHTEPSILQIIAFDSNKDEVDEEINVPEDPPVLGVCQKSEISLGPDGQNYLTENGIKTSKDSLSVPKQMRKLQPVVVLKSTEQRNSDGKKYHCFECQESSQSLDELIEHFHSIHTQHKFQHCGFYFTDARQHFCVKQNNWLNSSPSCSKKLTVRKTKFICRYCKKSFVRETYHKEHELRHIVVTHHRCECCGLYFPNPQTLFSHKHKAKCTPLIMEPSVHTEDKSEATHKKSEMPAFVYETGGSDVKLRDCYVKLVDVCKKKRIPEKIFCQVCRKNFRLRAQLKAHLRTHLEEKPIKCENCEKTFKYSWNLNKHKREQCSQNTAPPQKSSVPHGKLSAKYKCPLCIRMFKYSYNRTRHLREQCLKEYTGKGKGKVGENQYRCPLCHQIFTMACNRNRHIKTTCLKLKLYLAKGKMKRSKEIKDVIRTGEDKKLLLTKPIQKRLLNKCTICLAVYAHKSGLYRHMRKHRLQGDFKKPIKYKDVNVVDLKGSNLAGQRPTEKESAGKDLSLPFSCHFCGRNFGSHQAFRKHLQVHKGNKPFRCLDCGKTFARHGHLMAHRNVHKRKIQCSVCLKVLPSIGDLLKHRQSHPKKGMLNCPECPMQFKFPVYLLRHVATHERKKKLKALPLPQEQATTQKVEEIYKEEFKCAVCQKAFSDSKALSEHCLTHMPDPSTSKCQFCKRRFSNRTGLIRHIRLHTGEKPFPCLRCGRHFHRQEPLKVHQEKCSGMQEPQLQKSNAEQDATEHKVATALNGVVKPFHCSYCPHSFRFPNNLKVHERAHLAKTVFPCSKCGKFYRKKKMKDHENLCNGKELRPACRNCGRTFSRKNYRNAHEKQCLGKSKEMGSNGKDKLKQRCPHCLKYFRYRSYLLRHLSVHSREKPYACMHCGQKFKSQHRYLQHEAFCNGVSKEHCLENLSGTENNDLSFAEVRDQKGVKVAPGENLEFKCKFCTKTFSRPRNLRRHILTHTEVKPYRCKTCESCFSRYDHLKLHQARCRGKRQRLEVRVVKINVESLGIKRKCKILHENETFQCNTCSKQFFTSSDLKRHMSMLHITDKPFRCKQCGNAYTTKKSLRKHNLTVNCKKVSQESAESAKSNTPNQPCRETSKLLQRIQVHYMNRFKYQCEYCPRRFKLAGQLKVHIRLHTGEKPYGCACCGERFIRRDYLKRHLAKCSGRGECQEKVLCDKCGDLFTQDALSVHQKSCVVSSKPSASSKEANNNSSPPKIKGFSCANCSDRFLLFSQLQQHFLAKHRSDQPHQSNNDQKQLVSNNLQVIKQEPKDEGYGQNQTRSSQVYAMEQHKNSEKDPDKPFECPQCHMRFIRSSGLGMHMRIHRGVYPLSCKKCHVGFWTKNTMEKHRRRCTGNTIIKNNESHLVDAGELDCTQNDTVLVFNKGSNTTGTGVLQTKFSCKDQEDADKGNGAVHKYQCSECDQSFTDGLRLISHLEEHGREDQERRFDVHRCRLCSKVFSQAGLLQRHVKMQHNETVTNTCPTCLRNFRCPSELDIHRSCHDPNRPFVCDVCKLRFWTAKSLSIHHRHAHHDQPKVKESTAKAETDLPALFKCHLCDKTYSSKKSLGKHNRLKHRLDSVKSLVDNESKKSSVCQELDEEESNNFEDGDDSDDDSDSAPYFPCHVCGKTFITSESLEDHQRCHLGEKPFECEECGKCFIQLVNLQQHQRSHKSEFQCQMCGKGFVSLFALRKHKQTHIKKRPHRCTKCPLSFTRSSELAEHMVTHRDENFPCDLCDKTFSCKTSRAEHRKMHTEQEEELPPLISPKQPDTKQMTSAVSSKNLSPIRVEQYKYRCGICQVRFPDPEQLSEHGCNPAKERPYSCPECNKHFLHGSHLKKHQLSHQLSGPRPYQCNRCSMSFNHHHHFLTHIRRHGVDPASDDATVPATKKMRLVEDSKHDKIYQCPICPESFYQALDLANHLSVHSHMCSVCNMTFPSKKKLDEHEQCHLTAATQYECTECGDSFLGSDAFRKHHCVNRKLPFSDQRRSESSVSFPFKKQFSGPLFETGDDEEEEVDVGEDFINCPICQKRFSSNSSLLDHHKKYHEDPRPFKCLVCGKGFAKKRYLVQHQQIHSERPYQCNECPESFKTETTLLSHCKTHDTNRQYQCSICNKSYLTAQDLLKHERKHAEHQSLNEDIGDYRCDMCYKSFTLLSHLKKHQESHVGQVVYECTECDKAFAFLSLLEEHQQTHTASAESLQSQSPTHFSYQSQVNE